MAEIIVRDATDGAGTDFIPDGKFFDPRRTADGKPRAKVALGTLRTLWFNTGTLCNLACRNCYIESSPAMTGSSTSAGLRCEPILTK